MTYKEFAEVMAFLEAACGKKLEVRAFDAYFDLLGDLPVQVLMVAAKRVILEHPWATFPNPGELRQAASETLRGDIKELSPAECWDDAWHAVRYMDLEIPHTVEKAIKGLPKIVVEAIHAFGLPAMVYGKEPVAVIRAQFMKIVEQLQARDRRVALFPPALKEQIKAIGEMPKENERIEYTNRNGSSPS